MAEPLFMALIPVRIIKFIWMHVKFKCKPTDQRANRMERNVLILIERGQANRVELESNIYIYIYERFRFISTWFRFGFTFGQNIHISSASFFFSPLNIKSHLQCANKSFYLWHQSSSDRYALYIITSLLLLLFFKLCAVWE